MRAVMRVRVSPEVRRDAVRRSRGAWWPTVVSIPTRTPFRVGQRLALALLPSLLAVALVAALSYYGDIDRQAPLTLVVVAGVLAAVSIVVTWWNTRYLASRIARLVERVGDGPDVLPDVGTRRPVDEFDRIERTVDRLGSALSASEAERARAAMDTNARLADQATLLAAVSEGVVQQLNDVRLPLHILLDTPFGDLTPNQEELLADARDAAEQAMDAFSRLRALADADRGALVMRREWVDVEEVVRVVLPAVQAQARRRGARVRANLAPALPRAVADRTRLTAALALLLGDAATNLGAGAEQVVATGAEVGGVWVSIAPAPGGVNAALARRLLEAQGAEVALNDGALCLTVPRQ